MFALVQFLFRSIREYLPLLQKIMLGNCLDECGMDHGCLSMPVLKLALVQVPSHIFTG